MDYKQLMIGDWVQFTNTSKIRSRINCISPHQQHVAHKDNASWIFTFDVIEPVPLTEEILKANGFEYRENDNEWWHYDDYPFSDFQIGFKDPFDMRMVVSCNITNVRVNYVHELQHALRACKLDYLADNFEVPREPGQ